MNGRFLENIIRKKKRNTADLALDSGVPDKEIRKIIEENAGIKFDYAYKLCKALDIPLSSLCDTIPDGLAEMIEYPMFSLRTIRLIKEN